MPIGFCNRTRVPLVEDISNRWIIKPWRDCTSREASVAVYAAACECLDRVDSRRPVYGRCDSHECTEDENRKRSGTASLPIFYLFLLFLLARMAKRHERLTRGWVPRLVAPIIRIGPCSGSIPDSLSSLSTTDAVRDGCCGERDFLSNVWRVDAGKFYTPNANDTSTHSQQHNNPDKDAHF